MKTVTNKTYKPLRVPLPQGKTLHLGPLKTGQVSVHDIDHPPLQKLVESGDLEVADGTLHPSSGHETKVSTGERTHGYGGQTDLPVKGER